MFFKRHLPAVFVCLVFGLFFFISMITLFKVDLVQAADLTVASIKLERQKANTNPGAILVQFRTTESVVENGIQVTAGQAWNVSAVATDYTVSTSNLPAGVTTVPGIATAQSVVGNSVTFPASDLTNGVTYGFYITGGIASNPAPGNDLNYVWNVATLVAGTPSSDQDIGVPVIANDQIVFTARVGPIAQDFSAVVTTSHTGSVTPNNILSYTITYGSDYVDPTPLTLQFEWSLGTLEGSGTPTVPVFSYVDGSASQAYGATDPVIDTINRTITWTISTFPASTQNQTVTFQLQATAIDTGTTLVNVPVSARITAPVSTPDSTITHQYQFTTPTPSPTATPTTALIPTSSPQPTSTPQPSSKKACNLSCATDTECDTNYCYLAEQRCRIRLNPQDDRCGATNATGTTVPTLSPIPTVSAVKFRSITTTQISHDSISLDILLSQAKSIKLFYGTTVNDVSVQITSPTAQFLHSLVLPGLLPATTYYFRAETLDDTGTVIKSNLYQATTAQTKLELGDAQFVTVVTSRGIVLYNQSDQLDRYPLVIPQQTDYEVSLTFASDFPLTQAKLMIRGQNDFSDGAVQQLPITLTETKPRTFNGKLFTGMPSEEQFIILQLEDSFGNLKQIPLFSLIVGSPLLVRSAETREPIEHATLLLYRFDPNSKRYVLLPAPAFLATNPLYSLSSGQFAVVLPAGEYRAEISAFGYHSTAHDFTIGGVTRSLYPTIELSSSGWNILEMIKYYYEAINFKLINFAESFKEIRTSKVLFDTLSLLALSSLIGMAYLSLASRMNVSIRHLPKVISHRLWSMKNSHLLWSLQGVVVDEQRKAIGYAVISVLGKNNQIVTQFAADVQGRFSLQLGEASVHLLIAAKGFSPLEQRVTEEELTGFTQYVIRLNQSSEKLHPLHALGGLFKVALEGFFEMILLLALLMELVFIPHFGFVAVLPFMTLTSVNLGMWLIHLYHERMSFDQ